MTSTAQLHELGQSIWLDQISRDLLDSGKLRNYIEEFSVTGLTSNPSTFDSAFAKGGSYDEAITAKGRELESVEALFIELALEDLRRAADLFRPAFEASARMDGWVSMELSPLLAFDTAASVESAALIHRQGARENLFVKIPGTADGVPAIEEAIFRGIPVNVTLLFSCEQYLAAAHAYLRGIERRIAAGLDPRVHSVASLFVSRWDKATPDDIPDGLRNRLGIAMARRTYRAYRELFDSARWGALAAAGAVVQRLLWASTGTKDPSAPDTLYIEALVAPETINTMPEKTLLAFADHGKIGAPIPADGGDADTTLAELARWGMDFEALALQLQRDGASAFVESWRSLMRGIAGKLAALHGTRPRTAAG